MIKDLVQKLNDLKITQTRGEWEENIPEDIWYEYFEGKNRTAVKEGLDVDTHRWYETSITVIEFGGALLGIEYITNMFSESQDYEDCYHTIQFYEMEEYQTVSYKIKK